MNRQQVSIMEEKKENPVKEKKKLILEEHIIAALLLIMLAVLAVNVFARFLTGWSISFSEELVVYLFAVCSIVGASAACARGANMGLDAITNLLPEKVQSILVVAAAIFSITLFAVLLKQGIDTVQSMLKYGQKTPILRIPTWIFEIWYVIGAALYIFRVVQYTVVKLKEGFEK